MSDARIINVPQRFDFGHHKDFNAQSQALLDDASCKKIIMDFSRTDYLDSSALGMMVLLNKKAKKVNKTISLRGARDNTKDILIMANFNQLFTFE